MHPWISNDFKNSYDFKKLIQKNHIHLVLIVTMRVMTSYDPLNTTISVRGLTPTLLIGKSKERKNMPFREKLGGADQGEEKYM